MRLKINHFPIPPDGWDWGLFSFFRTRRPSSTSFTSYVLQFTIMPFNFKVKSKNFYFSKIRGGLILLGDTSNKTSYYI